MDIIMFIGASVVLAVWWAMRCAKRTAEQKIALLRSVRDPWFYEKMVICEEVSYDEHYRALLLFRDPMKLYREFPK